MNRDTLLDSIDQIYQSALKPSLTTEVVTNIGDQIGCSSVNLFNLNLQSENHAVAFSTGVTEAEFAHYMQHYYGRDDLFNLLRSTKTAVAINYNEMVTHERLREFVAFEEFYKTKGMYHYLGADILRDDQFRYFISFNRPLEDANFNDEDKAYFQTLIPHLQNAQQIQSQFQIAQSNQSTLFGNIYQMPQPVFALNLEMRVMHFNEAAAQLQLSKAVNIKHLHLFLKDPLAQKHLFAILQQFYQNNPHYPKNHKLKYGEYEINIMLLHADQHGELHVGKKLALLTFERSETQTEKVIRLCKQYQLTEKETKIMHLLVDGKAVQLISEMLSVTTGAVRFHLKNIFIKTDTHSQKELVLLFLK